MALGIVALTIISCSLAYNPEACQVLAAETAKNRAAIERQSSACSAAGNSCAAAAVAVNTCIGVMTNTNNVLTDISTELRKSNE